MPSRYYCNMCSRSFRRSAELRRHTSTEHNDTLERIARLEKALESLTGEKTAMPPSPPSSTNEHSASPEPMHQSSSEEPLLDSATINAQFLFVDRALNDVLIRLDCLERARKVDETKLRHPIYEWDNPKCRCATPREKIIERRARSLAQRIEKSPREMPQRLLSQESRMDALETTLERMTTGLRVALGRDATKSSSSTAGHPAWTPLPLRTVDMERQETLTSDKSQSRHGSKHDHNTQATQIVLSEEQDEESMEVDPALFGPSLWDRRQESMSEEASRVAEKRMSEYGRREHSNWAEDVTLKSVEVGLA